MICEYVTDNGVCCCACNHSDSGVCDIAGEVGCGNYAVKCSDYYDKDFDKSGEK